MTEEELLDSAASKSVLFCGERIIDVYHYVKPLGRPTKDAILSVAMTKTERFEGGVIAASNHARGLCKNVRSWIGGTEYEKVRYVEASHMHKLFQAYMVAQEDAGEEPPELREHDAVVVCDYGHGMANPEFIQNLKYSKYLAINVQTNSENYGFNLATKYGYADYLCVDEPEARLATQNRYGPIEDSLVKLNEIAKKVVVTVGKHGAVGKEEGGQISRVRAFTGAITDTMGAGDAFFAISALIAEFASIESILRIGNAAGALKSGIVGHRSSVTKEALLAMLNHD